MSSKGRVLQKPAVHRFHDALVKLNIDVQMLYSELDISSEEMQSKDGALNMDAYFSLLHAASRVSDIRFLAVELVSFLETNDMGILVYLISNAHNFEHALEILRRYIRLVSPGAEISLFENTQDFILSYKNTTTSAAKCYQDVEGTMAQFVLMIREVLDDQEWQPEQIYFAHPALNANDAQIFPLGKSVVYDHPFSGVTFPKAVVNYPIENADPKLLSILEAQVLQSTSDLILHDSFLERVRLLIASGLGNAATTSDDIAAALGMSRRTMYRRLHEYQTTYNTLREDTVLDLAKVSLTSSSAPIAHIAQELGYSDSSAFNRVFKRLTGSTPLKYRKGHAGIQ